MARGTDVGRGPDRTLPTPGCVVNVEATGILRADCTYLDTSWAASLREKRGRSRCHLLGVFTMMQAICEGMVSSRHINRRASST